MMRKSIRSAMTITALCALLASVACGGQKKATSTPDKSALQSSAEIEKGDSPYCDALAGWIAYDHFKVGGEGEPGAPGMPLAGKPAAAAANKAYRAKYRAFAAEALRLAPVEVKAAWQKYYAVISGPLVALDEKYHYIFTSPGYQAVMENPPSNMLPGLQAFDVIAPYENAVCGNGQPDPADVKFKGSATSQFCLDEKRDGEAFQAIIAAGTKPATVKAFVTSATFTGAVARAQNAPPEIRADAVAYATWTRDKWVPLVARFGYDFPKLWVRGTSVQRHAFNSSTPDIAVSYARIAAYDGEVCGL